jgi:hypothetical protein
MAMLYDSIKKSKTLIISLLLIKARRVVCHSLFCHHSLFYHSYSLFCLSHSLLPAQLITMFCHSYSLFCYSHSPLPAKLILILIPTYSPRLAKIKKTQMTPRVFEPATS